MSYTWLWRDIFGIGGYDDTPRNRIKIDDMMADLRSATESGNFFLPVIYRHLRRRDRLLRNNFMYMGSLTAFSDYFPLWTTAQEDQGGRNCDICKASAPHASANDRRRPAPFFWWTARVRSTGSPPIMWWRCGAKVVVTTTIRLRFDVERPSNRVEWESNGVESKSNRICNHSLRESIAECDGWWMQRTMALPARWRC